MTTDNMRTPGNSSSFEDVLRSAESEDYSGWHYDMDGNPTYDDRAAYALMDLMNPDAIPFFVRLLSEITEDASRLWSDVFAFLEGEFPGETVAHLIDAVYTVEQGKLPILIFSLGEIADSAIVGGEIEKQIVLDALRTVPESINDPTIREQFEDMRKTLEDASLNTARLS